MSSWSIEQEGRAHKLGDLLSAQTLQRLAEVNLFLEANLKKCADVWFDRGTAFKTGYVWARDRYTTELLGTESEVFFARVRSGQMMAPSYPFGNMQFGLFHHVEGTYHWDYSIGTFPVNQVLPIARARILEKMPNAAGIEGDLQEITTFGESLAEEIKRGFKVANRVAAPFSFRYRREEVVVGGRGGSM